MPTGYTANIKDGITFKQFIMNCARAFGACVTMRDDPQDTPIPEEFKPSDYHIKKLIELQAENKAINAMSIKEATAKAKIEYDEKVVYNEQGIKESNDLRQKYWEMLSKVTNWQPPTDDHKELKDFMVQQITESIAFDCGTEYYKKPVEILTGEQWLSKKKQSLLKDIAYYTQQRQEEVERTQKRNEWIKQLRNSVG